MRKAARPSGTSATHRPAAAATDQAVVPFSTPSGMADARASAVARRGPSTRARWAPTARSTQPPMIAAFSVLKTWNAP
ncbi:hypothetical protein O1L60_33685 [Streptomyces diastatochromogenes]|nr:hypothetical protein [Streptomyces diastatochromogenes]